jgi:VWFA-related protein
MRTLGLILVCLGIVSALHAAKRVSIEQLDQVIAQAASKSDADLAWQIADLQLTERLSPDALAKLEQDLPGDKSKQALAAVADSAEFLDLPAAEQPAQAAPDLAEQRRMMGQAAAYVSKTIPQLPNFFAVRSTTRFEDTPQLNAANGVLVPYEPMHYVGQSQATVHYQDGREVVDSGMKKAKVQTAEGLTTWGVFGPILGTVLVDAAQSKLAWSHWEHGDRGNVAIFAYSVPREKSHYEVNYCCIADETATAVAHIRPFRQIVGYHGEMTVDPASGVILRLKLEADLKPTDPVVRAGILVEYGPVEIAGRSYVCPLRSISITVAQTLQLDAVYKFPVANQLQPLKTSLNEVAYEQYHVFRSDAKVLTTDEAALVKEESVQPVSSAKETEATENVAAPSAGSAVPPAGAAAGAATETRVVTAAESNGSTAQPAASVEDAEPEVSVTAAGALPDAPLAAQPAGTDGEFTLRTTSRLVDVAVVVYDAKGHPVTDLKAEDFSILDGGREQRVQFLSSPGAGPTPAAATPKVEGKPEQPVYSNREPDAGLAHDAGQGNTTILLIDASNLAFGDLTYARAEMLRFLKGLPADERIGLYVLKKNGFEILLEPTADHAQVAATLTKWMPNAQDLANAQQEEGRNRRDVEYVDDLGDLFAANGNSPMGKSAAAQPTDAQLRAMGGDPARDAFLMMPGIARKLAAIAGHKSLVWVSSDNALVDWSDKAAAVERGNTQMDPLALTAEEALNNAHVSIYPLDASQLEAGGVSASLPQSNVQLNPAVSPFAVQAQLESLPPGEREEAQEVLAKSQRDINPGRVTDQMKQNMHPIQGPVRELAAATGGHALRRSGDIAAELNGIVADGRAAYSLSFRPDMPADNAYHLLTVRVVGRSDLKLRYRTGYFYRKEPVSIKDRFREAVLQPADISEVGVTATPEHGADGVELKVNIAAADLGLAQQDGRWIGKIDVFLVERDDTSMHAKVRGKTLALRLKPATYQEVLHSGVAFEEHLAQRTQGGNIRIVVVDESTGRIGSVTLPASAVAPAH